MASQPAESPETPSGSNPLVKTKAGQQSAAGSATVAGGGGGDLAYLSTISGAQGHSNLPQAASLQEGPPALTQRPLVLPPTSVPIGNRNGIANASDMKGQLHVEDSQASPHEPMPGPPMTKRSEKSGAPSEATLRGTNIKAARGAANGVDVRSMNADLGAMQTTRASSVRRPAFAAFSEGVLVPADAAPTNATPSGASTVDVASAQASGPEMFTGVLGGPSATSTAVSGRSDKQKRAVLGWELPTGVPSIIEPQPQPFITHDPGPGVIGLDR
jgi:hypothetical protein